MPVLRARSSRVEGGRCYPRVCWAAVNRSTHWGGYTHRTPSPDGSSQSLHLCARATSCNSWPVYTLARKGSQGQGSPPTPSVAPTSAVLHHGPVVQNHTQLISCDKNYYPELTQISSENMTRGDGTCYLESRESDQHSSGHHIMLYNSLYSGMVSGDHSSSDTSSGSDISSGSDTLSSSDTLSASETISANETLSACSASYSGSEDGSYTEHCAKLTGDGCCNLVSCVSVTSGANNIRNAHIVPTVEAVGQRHKASPCGDAPSWTPTTPELNGTSCKHLATRQGHRRHRPSLGMEQTLSNGLQHPCVRRENGSNTFPRKNACKHTKSSTEGSGVADRQVPQVLRQTTFTIARGYTTFTLPDDHTPGTEDVATYRKKHPYQHLPSTLPDASVIPHRRTARLVPDSGMGRKVVAKVPDAAAATTPTVSRRTALPTPPPISTVSPSLGNKQALMSTYPLYRRRTSSGVKREGSVGREEDKGGVGGRRCSGPGGWLYLPVNKGQRGSGSSKRGVPFARGNNSNKEHDHIVHSEQKKDHQSQPQSEQHRGRAMKISIREEATKKTAILTTPVTRTRSGSRSSGGASPATLHGRAPYKSATVAPAPTKLSTKTNSLNRFGFHNSAQVKSGDSTDSVNSILSDAQTVSDSNSNIFDLCDDDIKNNKSTKKSSDSLQCNNIHIETPRLESPSTKLIKTPNLSNTPRLGSGLQPGRITAFTRQLPKPQVVTVKSVSPKVQAPRSHSPKLNSPHHSPMPNTTRFQSPSVRDRIKTVSLKPLTQTPSKTQTEQTSRGKQQLPSNGQHIPRVSRDSESSTRSVTEADSGLGSSSESDKIQGEGETDTLKSCNEESNEDMSDAWLREKMKSNETVKRRPGNLEVCFNGTGAFELARRSLEVKGASVTPSPPTAKSEIVMEKKSKSSKEKREGPITYGMARQKFAPYSRNRFGYGYQSGVARSGDSSSSNNSNSPTSTVIKTPGSSGLVRNRVASLETTPSKKPQQTPVLRRTTLKKPIVRPTSLEKTPLLVMPVTEKTIELSKPVCRRLEYSECKIVKNDTLKDSNCEIQQGINPKLSTSKTVAGDMLIVGSVETEMQKDTNMLFETDNHGSYYENSYCKIAEVGKNEVPLANNIDSSLTTSFSKGSQDMRETEKLTIEEISGDLSQSTGAADTPNDITDTSFSDKIEDVVEGEVISNKHILQSPDDVGMKALTPQSESSFEILESLSETIDLNSEDIKDDADHSVTEPESSYESKATVFETKRESDVDSAASLSGSSVSLPTEGSAKPAVLQKPKQAVTSPGPQTASNKFVNSVSELPSNAQKNNSESLQKSTAGSPVDKKRPLCQALSAMKTSFESKTSMESSAESQKLGGMVNSMAESSDRSTLSGMCTPTLNAGRGDLDQDFLIDDEIADQPGLMFGESTMASSFFTDDGIFDDMASPSPSHTALKSALAEMGRSRADSVDTTSSLGADDLMLDFEAEEGKMGGSSNSSSLSVSLPGTLTGARPKKMHLRITIPGRRYDEEVLSPDASEIFSEWTAMMAEMGSTISDRCVSRDGSSCGGRTSRPRLGSSSEVASPDPRRPTVLRPPRQGGALEVEGGGVCLDRTTYHYMCQDVTALKTMLLRLRRVLQAAETMNPFDANLRNSLYLSLASSDLPGGTGINGDKDSLTPSNTEVSQENVDLRRQVVLLQQQLDERDRTIRLLQQQLAQSIGNQNPTCTSQETKDPQNIVNAATQTDRSARPTLTGSSLSRAASIDDGLGPTVSRYMYSEVDCDRTGRGRSTSASDHRQPRATSQPPIPFTRGPSNTEP
ncbi:uncharacterized protein LOC121872610 isoform X4 [Homarus americanus]|uniref:uncharacterized protein LOC121872610 isoform X4 n=1 Tax=Homarus americanus TaxID=6706 RepID=UPI001C454705|nr:uncharacterized protein LOC121872610 isoform X4 [Homarus americanus]